MLFRSMNMFMLLSKHLVSEGFPLPAADSTLHSFRLIFADCTVIRDLTLKEIVWMKWGLFLDTYGVIFKTQSTCGRDASCDGVLTTSFCNQRAYRLILEGINEIGEGECDPCNGALTRPSSQPYGRGIPEPSLFPEFGATPEEL